MNTGQLAQLLRAKYLVDVESFCKVQGLPLFASEIEARDRGAAMSVVTNGTWQRRRRAADQGRLPVRPGDALVPRVAATTRCCRRSSSSCPSSGSRRSGSCSSPGSAAPGGSRTTWTRTGCTASTAARPRSPPGSPSTRAGPLDLGRHRRRRRAVDRRQPPDPRAAPQRPGQDPAVQQPDLRAHQGPGVADLRARQGHQVDAVRRRRPPVQPGLRSRSAPRRRSSPGRSTATAST